MSIVMLEDELGLSSSRKKTCVIACSWTLARRVRPMLSRLGVGVKSKAKVLGAYFSCGKRISRATQVARVRLVMRR